MRWLVLALILTSCITQPDKSDFEDVKIVFQAPSSMTLVHPLNTPTNVRTPMVKVKGLTPGSILRVYNDENCVDVIVYGAT